MSGSAGAAHRQLPRTDQTSHPARFLLTRFRFFGAWVFRRRWKLEIRGAEHVPSSGPVVVAGNHVGFIDGPLMAIVGPRPVHALTKSELFDGALGAFLRASGQVPVNRYETDPAAVRTMLRVLREGGVAGMFPESTRGAGEVERVFGGAAYLALATGATVVPLSFLGTRLPGGTTNSLPPRGRRLVMSYGPPIEVPQVGWPRRQQSVRELSETIRLAMVANLREAEGATGMRLPGPLPGGEDSERDQT